MSGFPMHNFERDLKRTWSLIAFVGVTLLGVCSYAAWLIWR